MLYQDVILSSSHKTCFNEPTVLKLDQHHPRGDQTLLCWLSAGQDLHHPVATDTIFFWIIMAVPAGLRFFLWNARSLVRKTQDFKVTISDLKPHMIGVCETWLRSSLDLRIPGFVLTRKDRPGRVGGGLLLATKDTIPTAPLPLRPYAGGHLEVQAIKVAVRSGWIGVMVAVHYL